LSDTVVDGFKMNKWYRCGNTALNLLGQLASSDLYDELPGIRKGGKCSLSVEQLVIWSYLHPKKALNA